MGDIAERIAQAKAKVTDLKVIIYCTFLFIIIHANTNYNSN